METRITKKQLREALDATDAALAEFFGITRAAVAQWPDDEPIPELRQMQAMKRRPDLFAQPAEQPDQPAAQARVA